MYIYDVAPINNSIIYHEDKDLALHICNLDMQVKRVKTANLHYWIDIINMPFCLIKGQEHEMFFAHSILSRVKIKAFEFFCFLAKINQDRAKFHVIPLKAYFINTQRAFFWRRSKNKICVITSKSYGNKPKDLNRVKRMHLKNVYILGDTPRVSCRKGRIRRSTLNWSRKIFDQNHRNFGS